VKFAEYGETEQRNIEVLVSAGKSKNSSLRNSKDSNAVAVYDNKLPMSRGNLTPLPLSFRASALFGDRGRPLMGCSFSPKASAKTS